MSVYLDASVLVALFVATDAHSERARLLRIDDDVPLLVSDFAEAEFAAVIARLVRVGHLEVGQARITFELFDEWAGYLVERVETMPTDIRMAAVVIRHLDLNVRAPDAINLATARRLNARIATFDHAMAQHAVALGLDVVLG